MTSAKQICFLDFELRPSVRQLLQNGRVIPLGARAFDLLHCLIRYKDRIVTRDKVMKHVWSGILVGDNNLNVQVSILRKTLGPQSVITLPARGLRFGFEVIEQYLERVAPPLSLPDKPSIAILPLTDLGIEHDYSWLPDCIVEDLTTELSRFRGLFVVARNSAFSFRNQATDIREISRQLGGRYVVEGSVRTTPQHVRVTVQLIDATIGDHVFAENFDNPLENSLNLQTKISRAIVTAIAPQIDGAENARIRSVAVQDLKSHGIAQQGWSVISAGDMKYDPTPRDQAMKLTEQALAIDDNCGLAWRTIGWV